MFNFCWCFNISLSFQNTDWSVISACNNLYCDALNIGHHVIARVSWNVWQIKYTIHLTSYIYFTWASLSGVPEWTPCIYVLIHFRALWSVVVSWSKFNSPSFVAVSVPFPQARNRRSFVESITEFRILHPFQLACLIASTFCQVWRHKGLLYLVTWHLLWKGDLLQHASQPLGEFSKSGKLISPF